MRWLAGLIGAAILVDPIGKFDVRRFRTNRRNAQAADLMAGKWYFNVHTEAHKPGEIRGQVTK